MDDFTLKLIKDGTLADKMLIAFNILNVQPIQTATINFLRKPNTKQIRSFNLVQSESSYQEINVLKNVTLELREKFLDPDCEKLLFFSSVAIALRVAVYKRAQKLPQVLAKILRSSRSKEFKYMFLLHFEEFVKTFLDDFFVHLIEVDLLNLIKMKSAIKSDKKIPIAALTQEFDNDLLSSLCHFIKELMCVRVSTQQCRTLKKYEIYGVVSYMVSEHLYGLKMGNIHIHSIRKRFMRVAKESARPSSKKKLVQISDDEDLRIIEHIDHIYLLLNDSSLRSEKEADAFLQKTKIISESIFEKFPWPKGRGRPKKNRS